MAQLKAASTRLRMLQGEKLSFADEAEGLFGVRPEVRPLSTYDPVLARIEALVPGRGQLSERVEAFQQRFTIPTDRLKPVFGAALAQCQPRQAPHNALPPGATFTMAYVTGTRGSGYK